MAQAKILILGLGISGLSMARWRARTAGAAALRVADITDDWKLGIEIAEESIESGRALAKLRAMTGRDS